jgi:hypothetical protein
VSVVLFFRTFFELPSRALANEEDRYKNVPFTLARAEIAFDIDPLSAHRGSSLMREVRCVVALKSIDNPNFGWR